MFVDTQAGNRTEHAGHLLLDAPGCWLAQPLAASGVALHSGNGTLEASALPAAGDDAEAWIVPAAGARAGWALLAAPGGPVRVNGWPVPSGVALLMDRDEIRVGDVRCFLTLERVGRVEPFPAQDGRAVTCPRCTRPIEPETAAVQCPGCGTWHHAGDAPEWSCWEYAPACAQCTTSTALENGLQWLPEGY